MEIYLLTAVAVLISASAVFSSIRQLQMLQQNSYFPSRYYKWLRDSFSLELAVLAILFCLDSLLTARKLYYFEFALAAVLLIIRIIICFKFQKKSIKKLVFTSRVKRLIITEIIVLLLLVALYYVFAKTLGGEIVHIVCRAISFISPLLCLIAWVLTYPIENAFTRYYINDAKRILKSNPDLKVIGVTGSYGKTTTKFILNRILNEKFNTVCTPQSFNTPMGVVRTVRESIKPTTQVFVCEMGAKKLHDIKEICDIVNPTCGIITSVGLQHLDTFKTKENIFKTKFELADAIRKNGGRTFINIDSPDIAANYEKADSTFITFGSDSNLDCFADNIRYGADGTSFCLHLFGEQIDVRTKLLGRHAVCDILAAAALAYSLGVNAESIKFAVFSLKPTEHRLQLKPYYTKGLMIDDAYNANPEGCLEAVKVLGSFDGMTKIIITPGLIELGEREYEANYNLGLAAAEHCDYIVLVGENRSKPMRDAAVAADFPKEKLFVAKSFADAVGICNPLVSENTVVLIENDLPDNYLN